MGRSIIVLLTCILLVSLASAETNTTVEVANSIPILTQNIPDILVILDTPRINAFDLDDYFLDVNGDTMIFEHTGLNNVTITINSENQVSFYPDANYSGTQSMQFNASDAEGTATSNFFQVTMGADIEPPQWTNPKRNRPSVYQNYHITFTTEWTDNVDLQAFTFSINQGLGWQNQTITPFSGTSNTSTFKIQISAAAGTNVSWTFYAKDIYDNANRVDIQSFLVKEFVVIPGEEYDGSTEYNGTLDEGDSDVGGVSYGTGTAKLEVFKEGVLAENLEVDTRSIKVSLKQGTGITKVVKIINTGNTNIKIVASLKNMDLFAILGDTDFEILPGETHELLVEFWIPEDTMPDQYFGFLRLDYGDQISIPIVIDVKKFESEIEINVNLTQGSKAVRVGGEVRALITIRNLKDVRTTSSKLYYALKDFEGIIIESKNEDLELSTFFEEERFLTVPEGTPDGEYIFYARIVSEDQIDLDSERFLIGARFKIIAILKQFFYPFTILLLLLILLLLYLSYKRNQKKKRLLELYLLLNELRGLVKQGKTIEAMDIYKRIKITYGQHVAKDFIEDEAKLREELAKFSKILSEAEEKPSPKPEEKPSPEAEKTPAPKPKPQETKSK